LKGVDLQTSQFGRICVDDSVHRFSFVYNVLPGICRISRKGILLI
jgi:hypothetical protein